MTRALSFSIIVSLVLAFAAPANAQQYRRRDQPCREGGRLGNTITSGVVMGGIGAAIGAASAPKGHRGDVAWKSGAMWGGIGAATGASLPSCDEVHGPRSTQAESRRGEQEDRRDAGYTDSAHLRGQVVGIRGVQWNETMKTIIGDKLDKLGATLNGSTSSDPCIIPGTRVLCLVIGQFQPVDSDQRYGSFNSGIWGTTASSSDAQWRQRYAVAFTVKVFDTPAPTQANPYPREAAFQPEIASARGLGSAQGGQRHWMIYANGTTVSNGQSHQDYHQLAMVDAIVDALGKINWRQSALKYLAGQ